MPASAHLELARWLLVREGDNGEDVVTLAEAAENACQKLGQRLERLITFDGSQALMARAIHLANLEYSFLKRVQPDSSPHSRPDQSRLEIQRSRATIARWLVPCRASGLATLSEPGTSRWSDGSSGNGPHEQRAMPLQARCLPD